MAGRFSRVEEDFTCSNCGALVRGTGYTNHCPRCLWSRHVDVYPGDRAASCQAPMRPVGALSERGRTIVVQQCVGCGHVWRNRAADGDDRAVLLDLFGRVVPDSTSARPASWPPRAARQGRPQRNPGGNHRRAGR